MKRGLGLFLLLLLVAPVGAAQAKVLYNRDGIQLHGSAKVVAYNAATCRVVEEKYPEDVYEKMKGNDGHPLDIWQMDYSVHNGTGKLLSYLRAQFFIVSEWPPCTNWEDDRNLPAIQYKWSGRNPVIAMTYGMRLDQTVQETMYLLVFRGQEPFFKEWDVHFTFEPGAKQPGKSIPEPSPPIQRQEPGSKAGIENHCSGKPKGSACWMELSNQPECYVWNGGLEPDATVTWTGECTGKRAQGTGTLKSVWDGGKKTSESTGSLQDGNRQGDWVIRYADGGVGEGPYVDGKRHGRWVLRSADGGVQEGSYVDGKKQGDWVWRLADGGVDEGPYVEGKRHGRWVLRFASGNVGEGPYVEGKRHGDWVWRLADGGVDEGPYVEGKKQGDWVLRLADGGVEEGPYVEGKRHGDWVWRLADGGVEEGPYVEGKRHGRWVERSWDGRVEEGPYVEGKKQGRWVLRFADGNVLEGPYVEGKRHGDWVWRDSDGRVSLEGTYVNGKQSD